MQRGGNGQRGQGARQLIVLLRFPQQARFQHRLGQLFHEQRHAIRLGHHLLEHGRGQGFPPGHPRNHRLHLGLGQALQRHGGEMRAQAPRRLKLGPTGQQGQEPGRRPLLHQQGEELQRRGVDPVQVFHHKEDGLLLRQRQQPGQQGFQGFLLLPLGRQRQGRIATAGSGSDSSAAKRGTTSARGSGDGRSASSSFRSLSSGVSSWRQARTRSRWAMTG